jgi:hypothetical protein
MSEAKKDGLLMKSSVKIQTLVAFVLAMSLLALSLHAQNKKTIRVDQLVADHPSDQGSANLLTSKLISYLTKFGVPVVESGDEADAVLTGSYVITSATKNGYTRYHVQGAMRLTDKDGKVLWGDVVQSGPYVRSATSSFAENVAKKVAAFWESQKTEK